VLTIRAIRQSDAQAFLELCLRLDDETRFMMYEPGERRTTVAEQAAAIRSLIAADRDTILVAESDGQLVGYVAATGGEFRRRAHARYIVAGVLLSHAGQGIGSRLFAELERWARDKGLHRLELSVMVHNAAGIGLYRKHGFEIEGTLRHNVQVVGEYVDEYAMAKLLT
jgi:RimJ/RimL family protein N-acetyltransferase